MNPHNRGLNHLVLYCEWFEWFICGTAPASLGDNVRHFWNIAFFFTCIDMLHYFSMSNAWKLYFPLNHDLSWYLWMPVKHSLTKIELSTQIIYSNK